MPRQNKLSTNKVCCFCGLSDDNEFKFGKFYKYEDIVTHYYCLLLSSNMEQRGNDHEGILGFLIVDIRKEIRRGKRLSCTYCNKKGATLGCCNTKCKHMFHYPCGLKVGVLNQFFGEFKSFCISHRPKQKIDIEVKKELTRTSEVVCYICYDQVNPDVITDTIWAPCCKKNAWYHRKCIQQLALSAGYFFKCPLCNNKRSFQKAMLEFGIFIPSQDASWELVPNAFEELLYRYDQCDAALCLCPKGRKHTSFNAKWELVLCRTCGSQGIHMACGQLKWANPIWECKECISILGKSMRSMSSNTAENILQNDLDSEDSDSDISVGKESPIPFTSHTPDIISNSVLCPPGPRSFKLKHLQTCTESENLQMGSNNKQIDQLTNSVSKIANMEEHSVQSTSSKENYNSNLSTEHSRSQSPVDNDRFDNDDDIDQIINSDSLEGTETIVLSKRIGSIDTDSISNIKIVNVVSLALEEFEKVPSTENHHKMDNAAFQNETLNTDLKRKFVETSLYSTPSLNEKQKKMKTNGNIHEQKLNLAHVTVDVKESYLQTNNNKEKYNSANTSSEKDIQVGHTNENLSLNYIGDNVNHSFEVNKNKNNGCNMKNCDGGAGTSPAARSKSGSCIRDAEIECTDRHISSDNLREKSERSFFSEQWKSRNNVKTTTIPVKRESNTTSSNDSQRKDKDSGFDHPRLIPEYVHLRDLKFHVYNSKSLQMILFNKFSVNINIENKSKIEKNSRLEASVPTAVQQKFFENEASLNLKPENILHNICHKDKSKSALVNDQSRNYHDDTKENMDPLTTAPCKGVNDSLHVNTNLATYNLTTTISSSNQNEDRNAIQCTHNASKGIEEINKENCQQNDNLINNIENIFDALTNSNSRYVKSINNVTQGIQLLNSNCESSTEKNDFYKPTKLAQHTLLTKNHTNCKPENEIRNITATQFKVSIDLKKIEKFIDNNPNLFAKCEIEKDERHFKEVNFFKRTK